MIGLRAVWRRYDPGPWHRVADQDRHLAACQRRFMIRARQVPLSRSRVTSARHPDFLDSRGSAALKGQLMPHATGFGTAHGGRAITRGRDGVDVLGRDEIGFADQRRMRHLRGDKPLVSRVPAQHLPPTRPSAAAWDVVVGALTVPHLPTRIARIREDRRDRSQRPPITRPMLVAVRIHDGRTRHTLIVESASNSSDTLSAQPPTKNPSHRRCRRRIRFEPAQPPPPPGRTRR
jgi:hypothetical protein